MYTAEIQEWLALMEKYLASEWGLSSSLVPRAALLFLYLSWYKLNPIITSGYRSSEKQQSLLDRYNAGDKSIVYKPAVHSKHTKTEGGKPAALAIDISTSNHNDAATIAEFLDLRAGLRFGDPVHFYI